MNFPPRQGLILRDPKSAYVGSRSRAMLKVKRFKDEEATVVGYNWLTTAGRRSLACTLPSTGASFSVAVTAAICDKPPPKGSAVTIKFFELTSDGVPRFPVFKGVRTDV